MAHIEIKADAGDDITDFVRIMFHITRTLGIIVRSEFNGTRLHAKPGDLPDDIHDRWCRQRAADQKDLA